jgi:hypothetical protein
MSEAIVWRGFTRSALDAAFNNGAIVPDSAMRIADWTARSRARSSASPLSRR